MWHVARDLLTLEGGSIGTGQLCSVTHAGH